MTDEKSWRFYVAKYGSDLRINSVLNLEWSNVKYIILSILVDARYLSLFLNETIYVF